MLWRLGLFGLWPSSGRPPDGWAPSDLWHCSGRPRFPDSSGEGDPRGFEHVFAAVASDGAEAAILETQETVKRAGWAMKCVILSFQPSSPREPPRSRSAMRVTSGASPTRCSTRTGPSEQRRPEDHLVGRILPRGLHRHLTGLEQVGNGVGHGHAEELARRRMRVVEVPATRRVYPELRVLAEGGGDAAATFDEYGATRSELGQPEARTGNHSSRNSLRLMGPS
jgi:hypothetical protein